MKWFIRKKSSEGPEVFLGKGVLKNMHRIYRRTPMPKCTLCIFRTPFPKNTSETLLLNAASES